jgi:hypothetical protein
MARGLVQNCIVTGNRAPHGATFGGGGIMCRGDGTVRNCLVAGNVNYQYGAGVDGGTVESCTIVTNSFRDNSGVLRDGTGAGTRNSTVKNSIVYSNYEASGTDDINGGSATYSCAPGLSGSGNIDADPLFINPARGDYRLQSGSPCVNAGLDEPWMSSAFDLAGGARIAASTVDMGAYEVPPHGSLFIVR